MSFATQFYGLGILFIVFIVLVLVVIVVFAYRPAIKMRQRMGQWPTAAGTVVSAEIVSRERSYNDSDLGSDTRYTARIAYRYVVAGKAYQSNVRTWVENQPDSGDIRNGVDFPSEKHARQILDRYPVGASVLVHYSPENPADAVLET